MIFKTPYNHDTDAESLKTAYTGVDENGEKLPSLTQQSQAKDADINEIVRRFGLTGNLPQAPLPPTLEDFGEIFDFQDAMNTIAAARASFMALPAEIRETFRNDPHLYVSQVDNWLNEPDQERREQNLQYMRAMGLATTPGPKADPTTLGDVLKAIKERQEPGGPPAPGTPARA